MFSIFPCRDLYKLGFNRLSRGSHAHNEVEDGLPDPREEYYKFMVVRHPLERLASAYNNKVAGMVKTIYVKDIKVRTG